MKREIRAWRERWEADGAPSLLVDYVQARGLFVVVLRLFHLAAARLEEVAAAAGKAHYAREIRRDWESVVRDLRWRERGSARREREKKLGATLAEAGRALAALPTRADELRAWVALAAAVDDFDDLAALVAETADVVRWRHDAWWRWKIARERAAERDGIEVCHYVPTELRKETGT